MTTCTDNGPCGKGSCCEDNRFSYKFRTCTTVPSSCYTGDGTRDEGWFCSGNSECATQCCNRFTDYCDATSATSSCMSDGLAGWVIAMIVIFSIGFVVIVVVCICCCVRAQQRRSRDFAPQTNLTVVSAYHTAQPMHQHNPSNKPVNGYQNNEAVAYPQGAMVQGYPSNTQAPYVPQPVVQIRAEAPKNQVAQEQAMQSGNQEKGEEPSDRRL